MEIKNFRDLKNQADSALTSASYSPRNLAMIHGGVLLGFSLVLTLVNFALSKGIASTGGLSGMNTRTILTTLQSLLQFASTLLMPFWEIGFLVAAMNMVREKSAGPKTLLSGFSRFGTILWLMVLQSILLGAIGMLCFNVSMGIFMMTPLSQPLVDALAPIMEQANATGQLPMDDGVMNLVLGKVLPGVIIFLVLYLAIVIPILYRFRMSRYLVMDSPRMSAMVALMTSSKMMKKNGINLFKVDLHFWWFYVLQALFMALCYGDVILKLLHVELPMDPNVTYFLFYGLYVVLQFALITVAKAPVETTYAVVYDRLRYNLDQQMNPAPQAE